MKEMIYDLIPDNRFISRKELKDMIGISDRQIRRYISDIRKEHSIISLSSGKGYRKSKNRHRMFVQSAKQNGRGNCEKLFRR